jgi:SAM-dependent methyltransferase
VNGARRLPPSHLIARAGGAEQDYHRIGEAHATMIRSLLPDDWRWTDITVLDFGCGTGRTLVQFSEEARSSTFWGCDIDGPSIEWATANLSPPFRFLHNSEVPPLDLPATSFDLVYGMSVFTHLVDSWSAWLLEVHRLLRVGGHAVFTFLGEGMIREVVGASWDEDRVGMIEVDHGTPWSTGGPNVVHSEWWLRAHWGRAFEILNVRPFFDDGELRQGHGWIVLRKDDRSAPTVAELGRLEPDEPREIAALQFNLELLRERTVRSSQVIHAPRINESVRLRAELEALQASKSWRLTAPLRRLRRAAARMKAAR